MKFLYTITVLNECLRGASHISYIQTNLWIRASSTDFLILKMIFHKLNSNGPFSNMMIGHISESSTVDDNFNFLKINISQFRVIKGELSIIFPVDRGKDRFIFKLH